MPIIADIQTISTTIGDIIDFVKSNDKIHSDFEEYLKTINAINLSDSKLQTACIPYITERIIFSENKTIPEIYIEENKDLTPIETEIAQGLGNSISSIMEVKRVLRNGFIMYNLVNEKEYTVIPLVKMTNLRDVLTGQFALVRIFKFKNDYYMLEISDLIPSYEKEQVYNFAVAKMIEQPETVYVDNEEKFNEIKNHVDTSIKNFKELFGKDEVITTNKQIDNLVDLFNSYRENGEKPSAADINALIEPPETFEYFNVTEFQNNYDTFLENSMKGFASHIEKYDVGYIADELGLYVIPFWATLTEIFTSDNYKEIKNYEECVDKFIKNDKLPPSFIKKLEAKTNPKDFNKRLCEIMKEELSTEDFIKKYKSEYLRKTIFSSSNVLFCSKTFAQVVDAQDK